MMNNEKRGFRFLDPTISRQDAFLCGLILAAVCLVVFGTAIVVSLP